MRKLHLAFVLSLFFLHLGCKKDNNVEQKTSDSEFSFTANGTNYIWNGSLADNNIKGSKIVKENGPNGFEFRFSAMDNGVQHTSSFNLLLQVDKLEVKTYIRDFDLTLDGTSYDGSYSTNPTIKSNITFTNVENNLANGTFSGSVKDRSSGQIVAITNGKFSNVKILQ